MGGKRTKGKVLFWAVLCCVLCSALFGCGKPETKKQDKAMGRYVEEALQLPHNADGIFAMEAMDDGTIWAATYYDRDYFVILSDDSGKTWEQAFKVRDTLKTLDEKTTGIVNIAFGKKRDTAVEITEQIEANGSLKSYGSVWYVDADGAAVPILENVDSNKGAFIGQMVFDGSGNLLVNITGQGILQISLETKETIHVYDQEAMVNGIGVSGNILISFLQGDSGAEIHYYDLESGKPMEEDKVLSEQLKPKLSWSTDMPVLFAGGSGRQMFLCTQDGIYSHSYGGNVMEQAVDGSMTMLGSYGGGFAGFVKDDKDTFYVVKSVNDSSTGSSTSKLFRYYYDADIPTVPDEELKIYALDNFPELRQAAILYQKEYPQVRVIVQTAMDGIYQSGSTASDYLNQQKTDKLKILNTEILAGKGPDVLVLDEMPAEAYIGKGILADLTDALNKEDRSKKLLSNIVEAYTREDGKIFVLPARVRIPGVFGEPAIVQEGTDLTELAEVMKEAKEELVQGKYIYPYYTEYELTEIFLNAFASQLKKADGTLEESKVREFMEELKTILYSDVQEKSTDKGTYGGFTAYDKGIGLGLTQVYVGQAMAAFGEICSPAVFEQIESMIRVEPQLSWDTLGADVFKPYMLLGVSSKAANRERAEEFVGFMMSEQAQRLQEGNGIAICQDVLNEPSYWGIEEGTEEPKNMMAVINSANPNEIPKNLNIHPITDEQASRIRTLLQSLRVPYDLDVQVKALIIDETQKYLQEKETLDEAMGNLLDKINLYLSE